MKNGVGCIQPELHGGPSRTTQQRCGYMLVRHKEVKTRRMAIQSGFPHTHLSKNMIFHKGPFN